MKSNTFAVMTSNFCNFDGEQSHQKNHNFCHFIHQATNYWPKVQKYLKNKSEKKIRTKTHETNNPSNQNLSLQ